MSKVKSGRGFAVFLILIAATALAGVAFFESKLMGEVGRQVAVTNNIGEILRLDELLTMSARHHAATKNAAYRNRYFENVDELDRLIKFTLELGDSDEARAAVTATDAANMALVAMETKSFELADANQWEQALSLIESADYKKLKGDYADGMNHAFSLIKLNLDRRSAMLTWIVNLLCIVAFLIAVLGVYISQQARMAEIAAAADRDRLNSLRSQMELVSDAYNNALNSLQLFRVQAENGHKFTDEDLKLFDNIISGAAKALRSISASSASR